MKMKLTAKALPVAIALALAACGGSGDDNKVAKKPGGNNQPQTQPTPSAGNQGKSPVTARSKLEAYYAQGKLPLLGEDFDLLRNIPSQGVGEVIPGLQNDVAENINRMYVDPTQRAAAIQLALAIQEGVNIGQKITVSAYATNSLTTSVNPEYEKQLAENHAASLAVNERLARAVFCVHERFGGQGGNTVIHIRSMALNKSGNSRDYDVFGDIVNHGNKALKVPSPHKGGYCASNIKNTSAATHINNLQQAANIFFPGQEARWLDSVYSYLYIADQEMAKTRAENTKDFYLVKLAFEKIATRYQHIFNRIKDTYEKGAVLNLQESNKNNEWVLRYLEVFPHAASYFEHLSGFRARSMANSFTERFKKGADFNVSKYNDILQYTLKSIEAGNVPALYSSGGGQIELRQFYSLLVKQKIDLGAKASKYHYHPKVYEYNATYPELIGSTIKDGIPLSFFSSSSIGVSNLVDRHFAERFAYGTEFHKSTLPPMPDLPGWYYTMQNIIKKAMDEARKEKEKES